MRIWINVLIAGGDVAEENRRKKAQFALGKTYDRPIWGLWLSICIRAVHQLGAAVFLASWLLGDGGGDVSLYLYLAVFSGLALCFVEGVRHRQMYREVSGLVTFCKCVLIGLGLHGFLPPEQALLIGFILASIGAHAPKQIRHRLVF